MYARVLSNPSSNVYLTKQNKRLYKQIEEYDHNLEELKEQHSSLQITHKHVKNQCQFQESDIADLIKSDGEKSKKIKKLQKELSELESTSVWKFMFLKILKRLKMWSLYGHKKSK